MRKSYRLGALQMRVTRHHQIEILFSKIEQRGLQISQATRYFCNLCFYIEPKIERNLVVPAARGMKLRARGTDSLRKRCFDIHVHVFERRVPVKFARFDLLLDRAQLGLNFSPLASGYDSRPRERSCVRDRSCDIMRVKSPIE